MATHKSLKVTFWTRTWDLIKGILLYGSVNWQRASDELQPPKLTPSERKMAMPAKNLEVIKPRHNPQAALIKTLPKKLPPAKIHDVTAGAIVSDPQLDMETMAAEYRRFQDAPRPAEKIEDTMEEPSTVSGEPTIVRRRRRHHRNGLLAKRAPRTAIQFAAAKPGLIARLFGAK